MIRIVAIIFVLASICFSQQTINQKQENINDGEKIIRQSREAIGIKKLELNSIKYKVRTSTLVKTSEGRQIPDSFAEVSIVLPDKIQTIFSMGEPIPYISTKTWNGEKYKSFYEMNFGGQRIVKDDTNLDRNNTLKKAEGIIAKDKLEVLKNAPRLDPKDVLVESMWTELFPLILTHPFEPNLKFNFVGKAKANGITANVVDFKPKNGKSYRLLFDTETNYLLMMIVNYKRSDPFFTGDVEIKYYFSDRELTEGVSIPRKIKVENKRTASGQPPKIDYSNIDILEFKLNPEFKKEMFEIK